MARYSSNIEGKLQIKALLGKECSFTSIFDMLKPLVRHKTELAHKKTRAETLPHFLGHRTDPLGTVSSPKLR